MNSIPFFNLGIIHNEIKKELFTSFRKTLGNSQFILGEQVRIFEKSYASFCGTKYCIGTGNGLDALIIALRTLNIGKGDEVIIPSNTYIATALAVSNVGATPVLVEPRIQTYNIDPNLIEEKVTSRTKAIIPVHLFGQACEMDSIMKIAKRNKLFVVEDNAQAQGATFNGKKTGSFGHINATSFYPSKNIGALGDAGAITTDFMKYSESASLLRNYGSKKKYYNEQKGMNSRLDELHAAVLSLKLKKLFRWNGLRKKIAIQYLNSLANLGDIVLPQLADQATSVWHQFVIRTKYRKKLVSRLESRGIGTMIHYPVPIHLQKAYADLKMHRGSLALCENIANTSLSLPIYPGLSKKDVDTISLEIKNFFLK